MEVLINLAPLKAEGSILTPTLTPTRLIIITIIALDLVEEVSTPIKPLLAMLTSLTLSEEEEAVV